jgi:hypothetical protein
MDEQEGSRKREAERLKFPPIMWVKKKKLNGKVPVTKRDSKGHLYIVAAYDDTMEAKVIPDNLVVSQERTMFRTEQSRQFRIKEHTILSNIWCVPALFW